MKTLSKVLFTTLMVIAVVCFLTPVVMPQSCDPDIPFSGVLPHPDNNSYEAKLVFQTTNTVVYEHMHCGINKVKPVDPCDPWVMTFYVYFSEQNNDQVLVKAPVWNWDTAMCQLVYYDVIYPANYVQGTYYDSVVMKVTMKPHERTDWLQRDTATKYVCEFPTRDTVLKYWWTDCMHERIVFEAIDSCEVPNSAICRIEWDKPLPVELLSFISTVSANNVTLNWTTSKEINNAGFYVERYTNGTWNELTFIQGKGNTTGDYAYTDKNVNSGAYSYRLKQVDFNGNFEYYELEGFVTVGTPEKFMLAQNYPNPFNPTTTIVYGVPNNGPVTLKIYDNSGKEVATLVNEPKTEGYYTITFSAPDLASGIYFYKLESGNYVATKKMVLMK
jgi:hypothetical protein